MIPVAFDYQRAESADEAVAALAEHGDEAKLLAGGHSLLPMMKLRLAVPSVVIDVGRVTDLSYVNDGGDHVAIGALTRHRDVETNDLVASQAPLLAKATTQVGDPQVRHRGTIGGSLAHADPAADLPSVLLAMGGSLVAKGPNGERVIPAGEFFTSFLESTLAPDEMLTEVRIPKMPDAGWSFQKFNRRAQDFAIVGCSVVRQNGSCGIGLVNMGSTPLSASAAEAAISGGSSVEDAAAVAAEGTDPSSDLNASEEYRRHLARVLVRRGLEEASS
ncbi:MAG: xanthine dehydrogenase family protein subunit M [Actinomycetia bacterium]|nr:xanthine dehydrogenase family protein subunit M [Actinomycetes bacterium]MCP3913571.1 xanthine dehydrogenase family protein subunit M [Actinomycetes bacterium]MCP4085892.1 xanthine dehydrogenase family protein subunit M [Actinomycetes bacterium]